MVRSIWIIALSHESQSFSRIITISAGSDGRLEIPTNKQNTGNSTHLTVLDVHATIFDWDTSENKSASLLRKVDAVRWVSSKRGVSIDQRDLSACHLATIRYTKKSLSFSFW